MGKYLGQYYPGEKAYQDLKSNGYCTFSTLNFGVFQRAVVGDYFEVANQMGLTFPDGPFGGKLTALIRDKAMGNGLDKNSEPCMTIVINATKKK